MTNYTTFEKSAALDSTTGFEHLFAVIPVTWISSFVIGIGSALVISYLRSKPPLSQTVMDYAIGMLLIWLVSNSIFVSSYLTLAVVFKDCGEVVASLIGYAVPASGQITFIHFCAIFILQAMIVRNPEFLGSAGCEKMVKYGMAIIVPLVIGLIYTTLYFGFQPLGPYIILRGMGSHSINYHWARLRFCTDIPIGIASTLSFIITTKIRRDSAIESNHILSTKGVLVSVMGLLLIGGLTYLFVFIHILNSAIFLLPLLIHIIKSVCIMIMAFSHPSVRSHISNMHLLRNITLLLSVRQSRQVGINEEELNRETNERQTNGMSD